MAGDPLVAAAMWKVQGRRADGRPQGGYSRRLVPDLQLLLYSFFFFGAAVLEQGQDAVVGVTGCAFGAARRLADLFTGLLSVFADCFAGCAGGVLDAAAG